MDIRLMSLSWLTDPPANFGHEVRRLLPDTPNSIVMAHELAQYHLTGVQLHILGKAISRLAECRSERILLGIISNGTSDSLGYAITASCMRYGVLVQTICADFDQVASSALDPMSRINLARCDFVLLAVDHRGLPLVPTPGDQQHAQSAVAESLRYIEQLCISLRSVSASTVILQTIPQVVDTLFGSLDRTVPGTLQWLIDQYNHALRERFPSSSVFVLDSASLAEAVGLCEWHDPIQWGIGKLAFSLNLVPIYSDWVARLISAARGKARKCLVLDLDNTLWGGVIGDDGLEGIVLGNGTADGESFLAIQRMALALRARGIILAVSSKNDDAIARSPFRSHPEMLIREHHISVFQANWCDKASNLVAISTALNIGIDALVLLDDNPAERAQVRRALPAVAVPELPANPAFYPQILMAAGYFEAIAFTADDRGRADQYRANAARTAALTATSDLQSYLHSLEMKAICAPFDAINRARIAQLINKSNQFNLTTRRYTEAQVESFEQSQRGMTLHVRLIDRFGDNGIISVVICQASGLDWVIDTWLMSCRVLNREVERAVLNHIVSKARTNGVRSLLGQYVSTNRNSLVKDHYGRLGFELISMDTEESRWSLCVDEYVAAVVPIEIVDAP